MQKQKMEFNIAVIRNNTTMKQLAKEWGIHPMVLYRVSSGAAKSKRITDKIKQYIKTTNSNV